MTCARPRMAAAVRACVRAGVPVSYLLSRGQSIKVFSQLLRKARSKGFVIPNIKVCIDISVGRGPALGACRRRHSHLAVQRGAAWHGGCSVRCDRGGAPRAHAAGVSAGHHHLGTCWARGSPWQACHMHHATSLPAPRCLPPPPIQVQGPVANADGVGYEGATVLEPKIGFYESECWCGRTQQQQQQQRELERGRGGGHATAAAVPAPAACGGRFTAGHTHES